MALSLLIILLVLLQNVALWTLRKFKGAEAVVETEPPPNAELTHKHGLRRHIEELGGGVIFGWRISRMLACAVLFALSVYSATLDGFTDEDGTATEEERYLPIALAAVYVRTPPDLTPWWLSYGPCGAGLLPSLLTGYCCLQRCRQQSGSPSPSVCAHHDMERVRV